MKSNAMAIGVRTRIIYGAMAIMTIILSMGENTMAQTKSTTVVKNIVLVHGGLVDGSGWEAVYNVLKKDGFTVTIVQNPTISLADDVAVTKRAIAAQNGPVILVGHSYGGAVITEAGNDPRVVGLVYVAAFALDKGESVSSLIKDPPPSARGWLSAARQSEIPCIFRRRCDLRKGRIHGRLASAVGSGRARRHYQRSGMEGETCLVPANDRG
jgi:pimeloyl-ACP methyl ester carboxylesterase